MVAPSGAVRPSPLCSLSGESGDALLKLLVLLLVTRYHGLQILLDVMGGLTVVVPVGPLSATDDLHVFVDNSNMCVLPVMAAGVL